MGTLARKGLTLQRLISTNVNGQKHIKIPAVFVARCLVCNTIFWRQGVLEMTAGYALLAEAVSGGALWKRCFWKFSNNNLKTPVLESLFIFCLETCDFIKKRLQHRCFHVNIEKILRTLILKNICEQLLFSWGLFLSSKLCWRQFVIPQKNSFWVASNKTPYLITFLEAKLIV